LCKKQYPPEKISSEKQNLHNQQHRHLHFITYPTTTNRELSTWNTNQIQGENKPNPRTKALLVQIINPPAHLSSGYIPGL
jgi:hypothetical protein